MAPTSTLRRPRSSAWNEGEPNNYGGREDCVAIWGGEKWSDWFCSAKAKFVCEKRKSTMEREAAAAKKVAAKKKEIKSDVKDTKTAVKE